MSFPRRAAECCSALRPSATTETPNLSGEKAVAALVKSWNVDFILTVGDNVYAPQTLDNAVGSSSTDYIGGYQGSYGAGSAVNRFFPTLGNHEYERRIFPATDYFALPDNERYYDFQVGPVHFFALNSNKQEQDGRSATSVQAQWMQSVLADSDARFNVAYFHHTPYTPSGGTSAMRWPLREMGRGRGLCRPRARLLPRESGRQQRRRPFPYITTGLGGAGERAARRRRQSRDGNRRGHADRVLHGRRLQRDT